MIAPDPGYWAYAKALGWEIGEDPGTVYVLNLPVPVWSGGTLGDPTLTSHTDIPSEQCGVVDRKVTVPCVAVNDKTKTAEWIVANSPTYTLQRRRSHALVASLDQRQSRSDGEIRQRVGWGVSKTKTTTYSESVGVTIGFEAGAEVEGIGVKVTGSLTHTLGYEQSYSNSEMFEQSVEVSCGAAAGTTTALYVQRHIISVRRGDSQESYASDDDRNPVDFKACLRYTSVQYPPPSQGEKANWSGVVGRQAEQAKRDYYDGDVPITSSGGVNEPSTATTDEP